MGVNINKHAINLAGNKSKNYDLFILLISQADAFESISYLILLIPDQSKSPPTGQSKAAQSAIDLPIAASYPNMKSVVAATTVGPSPSPIRLAASKYTAIICARMRFGVMSCKVHPAIPPWNAEKNTARDMAMIPVSGVFTNPSAIAQGVIPTMLNNITLT